MSDNKKLPLSFRGSGAFVIHAKTIFNFDADISTDNVEKSILVLIEEINLKVAEIQGKVTDINSFILYVKDNPDKGSKWFDTDILIVTFMLQSKFEEALHLLADAKQNRGMCSWGFGDKNFYDLAIEYCKENIGRINN